MSNKFQERIFSILRHKLTLLTSLQNTKKKVHFAPSLKIQRLKSFQLQGLRPLTTGYAPGPPGGTAPRCTLVT